MQKPKTYTVSKHIGKLWFDDFPPGRVAYFEHDFGSYRLEARVLFNDQGEWPHVMSIHGARSDYTKSNPLMFGLQERGISSLNILMSGHSAASPLKLEQTSLAHNIKEAEAFFRYLDSKKPKIVIAFSLGGTPALKLLKRHSDEIAKLVLFYPGIYSVKSYSKHFGKPFREVLHQPFSYRDSDTLALLKQFKGQVMLVKGQYDGLDPLVWDKPAGTSVGEVQIGAETYYSPIPKETIDMIRDAVPTDRMSFIEVPGCDHSVMLWMREHQNQANDLIAKVADFI